MNSGFLVGSEDGKPASEDGKPTSEAQSGEGSGSCASGKLDHFGRCIGAHGGKSDHDPTGKKSKKKSKGSKGGCAGKLDFFGRCIGAHGGKSNHDPTGRKSKKKNKGGSHVQIPVSSSFTDRDIQEKQDEAKEDLIALK